MSAINLDFTGVEVSAKRIPQGTHTVTISSAEEKVAASGNHMLAVTFKTVNEEVAFENFVLIPQSMWKLKMFLEAVFQAPFTGKTSLEPRNLIGRKVIITCIDEDYINNNGNPAVRSSVQNDYKAVSLGNMMGVAPEVPNSIQNPAPVAPAPQPTVVSNPVPNVAPQQVAPQVQPQVSPQPAPVQPTVNQSAIQNPAPTTRPKLPWEM